MSRQVSTATDPRKPAQVGPCLILEDERDSMPVEVFLMFQWTIFFLLPHNEMPLYAPPPGMPIAAPSVNACLVFHLALL